MFSTERCIPSGCNVDASVNNNVNNDVNNNVNNDVNNNVNNDVNNNANNNANNDVFSHPEGMRLSVETAHPKDSRILKGCVPKG